MGDSPEKPHALCFTGLGQTFLPGTGNRAITSLVPDLGFPPLSDGHFPPQGVAYASTFHRNCSAVAWHTGFCTWFYKYRTVQPCCHLKCFGSVGSVSFWASRVRLSEVTGTDPDLRIFPFRKGVARTVILAKFELKMYGQDLKDFKILIVKCL